MSLNVFGCPLSTRERHTRLMGEAIIDRTHQDEIFHSCGIWLKASYTNHSCCSNARRAFIGDMMIVRAAQDLEPNTEITVVQTASLGQCEHPPTQFPVLGLRMQLRSMPGYPGCGQDDSCQAETACDPFS